MHLKLNYAMYSVPMNRLHIISFIIVPVVFAKDP